MNTKDGTLNLDKSNYLNSQLIFTHHFSGSSFHISYNVGDETEEQIVERWEKRFKSRCSYEKITDDTGHSWYAWVIKINPIF